MPTARSRREIAGVRLVTASRGVVAAGHRGTAQAGADVLRDGGNALDAAIAAVAMACVCEPVLCSPGGAGFAMVRDGADGRVSLIDFFGQTPIMRNEGAEPVVEVLAEFGAATQGFHIGPATTSTPGFFGGVRALHRAGATVALDALFARAARAARDGVRVTLFQHHLATVVGSILRATDGAARLYAPDSEVMPVGAVIRNPGLADALELLAVEGFAGSEVGRACVALQHGRGHLTADDLAAYEVVERTPLTVALGGATVHLNPLPAASGVLIAHTLQQLGSSRPIEAAQALIATNRARRLADGQPGALAELSSATLRQRGTTHVSVVDGDGNACAVTMSNGEGNGEVVDDFGFMLNNILGEEDVNPAGAAWPVDTRLSSMMCPTMIETAGGGLIALGSGGSNRIRSAISQVVVRLCLDGADLREAITAPRLHVEGDVDGGHLDFEDSFDDRTRSRLRALFPDHRAWPEPDLFFGGVHAARRDRAGTFTGAGDTRRDGAAIVVAE